MKRCKTSEVKTEKKPYRKPRLCRYGQIAELTLGNAGGSAVDGTMPHKW